MRRALTIGVLAIAVFTMLVGAGGGSPVVHAAPPGTDVPSDESGIVVGGNLAHDPPVTLPLVPVPVGCTAPAMPHIVFVGTVTDRDFRTVRFEIESIRTGRSAPFAVENQIDVRFGLDTQYLDNGERYLVAAVVDPDLGLLVSRVTDKIEHFGGDEVIGVSETDVDCPVFEDPMRTLHVDGTPIDGNMLQPFLDSKFRVLSAILVPFGVAMGVVFLLAMFRLSLAALYRGVVDGGRRRFS
jgi:hypothetical protein